MPENVRVRFAPSPTGPLHIGGVRTALFNYLFAKKHNGTFVLRIEDTDRNRYVEGAEEYIIESLNWCRTPFDEGPGKDGGFGPYRQSERQHIYRKYAERLVGEGKAYYAFDTPEELSALRTEYESRGETFIYNWHNRNTLRNSLAMTGSEVQELISSGVDHVIRFLSPKDETLEFHDEIRGDISIDTNILDDKILFKADGMPTYHLANVVDDHLMEISHVIRGEEWLPSLALHHQLYWAFGWQPPKFAHLPLILKPTGKGKLSKRDGDKMGFPVFPLEWKDPATGELARGYREDGYFPEAVINFLAFLGWNPGTEQEIFSLEELVRSFSLERVHKAGARFDPDKTRWFNHHYMQGHDSHELAIQMKASYEELSSADIDFIAKVIDLLKERATFIGDFRDMGAYFFESPKEYDKKATKKAFKPDTAEVLRPIRDIISELEEFEAENIQSAVKGWITKNELGFGKVMMPLRIALVGSLQGPDVFEIMSLIGKTESIDRIDRALKVFG